jgi:Mrp family chromosome partitioning ATPase
MSKIYEALEEAQKEKRGAGLTSAQPASHRFLPVSAPNRDEQGLEKEMLGLYQSIDSLLPNSLKKVIQFIGSREGEGASTIACEFGRVTARKLGKSVLILDTDCNKPRQHLFFRMAPEFGWEDLLRGYGKGNGDVDKVLYQVEESSLYICPASPSVSITHHVFDSLKIDDLLKKLKERFDLILVDSAPALASSDGVAISRNVDGVVLVLEAETTRWPVAENAKVTIEKNGGKILGVVFNKRRYHIPDFIYERL